MKYLETCENCKGSLHQIYDMPGKYYCPTCKRYYEKTSFGWKEVHA